MGEMTDDPFDQWLTEELESGYRRISSRPVPASPRYRVEGRPRSTRMSLFASLPAALTTKLAMGLTAAAMATTGGAAIVAVNTGSHQADPAAASAQGHGDEMTSGGSRHSTGADTRTSKTDPPAGSHGAAVVSAVDACKKAEDAAGSTATNEGIGQCVSKVARTGSEGKGEAHEQGVQGQGQGQGGHDQDPQVPDNDHPNQGQGQGQSQSQGTAVNGPGNSAAGLAHKPKH
ncbi:MAG: hypothetical protein NVS3B18_05860 [Candidatus Dormibacteria bacterium]